MKKALLDWAARRGYRIAWSRWELVREVYEEFGERRRRAELDSDFDREFLRFCSAAPERPEGPGPWIVLVAVPRPTHSLTFSRAPRSARLLLPPTYVRYRATGRSVLEDLSQEVFSGAPLDPLLAPLKALAARLGLVSYGRNNVTYAEGLGSYLQLVGGVTRQDLSEGAAVPREPAVLDACRTCTACIVACPTAAIPEDRFLLHAERCLVFFNERPDPFPEWIPQTAHRCAIGCMACQVVCPVNRGLLRVERDTAVFAEEETAAILAGEEMDHPLLRSAAEKLESLQMTEPAAVVWRNVRAASGPRLPGKKP